MLGPNYGKWWNERPMYAWLRYSLIILPIVPILLWMLYQYTSGVYLRTDIREAVDFGNLSDIRALILNGADPDFKSKQYGSPLHWAVCRGEQDIATHLIDFGADTEIRDPKGNTALHKAARHGNYFEIPSRTQRRC